MMLLLLFFCFFGTTATCKSPVARAFVENEVVPDLLPVPPKEMAKVTFMNGTQVLGVAKLGNELLPTQAQVQPKVQWKADPNKLSTLAMMDTDSQTAHWLVVDIPGDKVENGTVLSGFFGAYPQEGAEPHRYVQLVYEQPGKLNA